MSKTRLKDIVRQRLVIQQFQSKQREQAPVFLAQDVKTLLGWFSHDVLALAGPPLSVRQELFDFIVSELKQREDERYPTIRKLRKALHNQRDQLLAFAGVVDQKLADCCLLQASVAGRTGGLFTAPKTRHLECLLGMLESIA